MQCRMHVRWCNSMDLFHRCDSICLFIPCTWLSFFSFFPWLQLLFVSNTKLLSSVFTRYHHETFVDAKKATSFVSFKDATWVWNDNFVWTAHSHLLVNANECQLVMLMLVSSIKCTKNSKFRCITISINLKKTLLVAITTHKV